eukprot:jgi/Mesvir1/21894/Mv01962-RA.2
MDGAPLLVEAISGSSVSTTAVDSRDIPTIHPLDPLGRDEVALSIVEVLANLQQYHGAKREDVAFVECTLHEPSKQQLAALELRGWCRCSEDSRAPSPVSAAERYGSPADGCGRSGGHGTGCSAAPCRVSQVSPPPLALSTMTTCACGGVVNIPRVAFVVTYNRATNTTCEHKVVLPARTRRADTASSHPTCQLVQPGAADAIFTVHAGDSGGANRTIADTCNDAPACGTRPAGTCAGDPTTYPAAEGSGGSMGGCQPAGHGSHGTIAAVVVAERVPARVAGRVETRVVEGVQPSLDGWEYRMAEAAVLAYAPFQEAMRRRGVEDLSLVMVDPWCVGYFGPEHDPKRRLARALIYCRSASGRIDNGYARPVEGIHAIIDLQTMEVVEFSDNRHVPLPPVDPLRNYKPEDRPPRRDLKPLLITQPEGPSFRVDGYKVSWQKWSFRVGFTSKEGLVLYSLSYLDDDKGSRSVAHRISFAEMVVPYGDPGDTHYLKNAFDGGEDGLGKNAHNLKLGCDCLGHIHYFAAHLSEFRGGVNTIDHAVCMHEEDYGMLWKHVDWRTGDTEMRRSRRLVLSFIATIANYEYGFYWNLYQDGTIQANVKLTGILSVGALAPGQRASKYGTTLAPQLYAPIHQHFFVARMDMAVDSNRAGDAHAGDVWGHNRVVEVNVAQEAEGAGNPHGNAFYAVETRLASEAVAARDVNLSSARFWMVESTKCVNRGGNPTAWRLVPGSSSLPFARPNAKFLRRAGFLRHTLWVTRFNPEHRYPGGAYPNQNPRVGDGLPSWAAEDKGLEDANVVLWYNVGLTHLPRAEDWPVMPVENVGFTLQPHNFFDSSPAMDVPRPGPHQPPTSGDATACCQPATSVQISSKL